MRFIERFIMQGGGGQLLLILALILMALGALAFVNGRVKVESSGEPSFTYQLGAYPPAAVEFTLEDSQRHRSLPLKIYYPKAEGVFPVIFFSHGTGGSRDAFIHLSRFWASHGYIIIHPSHPGSDKAAAQEEGIIALLDTNADPQQWLDRAQDMTFLISSLPELARRIPALRGRVDGTRIGMSGHSFGAFTTMLLGGAKVTFPGGRSLYMPETRVRACLAISPQGTGKFGLSEDSWSQINLPVMTVSGTRERGESWRKEPFDHMPKGNKFHLVINGAAHGSYNDYKPKRAQGRNGRAVMYRTHLTLQKASLAFWDRYLKGDDHGELQQFMQEAANEKGTLLTVK